jgi:protein involved in polysaccharide export with SLBB domain
MNTATRAIKRVLAVMVGMSIAPAALAGVEIGNSVKLTIRGVPNPEQQQVNGVYRVGEGGLRLPLLPTRLPVRGLTEEQVAAAVEKAYRDAGIYQNPSVEAEVVHGDGQRPEGAVISVGGQVARAGVIPFRKGMTVVQALQAAGDRNAFGGRNITIYRGKKLIRLDYRKPEHKNFELLPDDTLSVEQRGPVELDRG